MHLKQAFQGIYNQIIMEIGTDGNKDANINESIAHMPDIDFSLSTLKKAFERTNLLKTPQKSIELEQYLQNFAKEIIRAGILYEKKCKCGKSIFVHVISLLQVVMLQYADIDSGGAVSAMVKNMFASDIHNALKEFNKYAPSNN